MVSEYYGLDSTATKQGRK